MGDGVRRWPERGEGGRVFAAICDRLCALVFLLFGSCVEDMPSQAEEARSAEKRSVSQEKAAEAAANKARTTELAAQDLVALPSPDGSEENVSKDKAFRRWGAKGQGAGTKGCEARHQGGDHGRAVSGAKGGGVG